MVSRDPVRETALLSATQLLVLAAATECAAAAVLAAGGTLSPLALAGGAASALAVSWIAARRGAGPRAAATATLIATAVTVAGVLVAGAVYDVSWDGQAYHQLAVIRLGEGWNPYVGRPADVHPWVIHFPKGAALRGAAVVALGAGVEAAKGWTIPLAVAGGLACVAAFRSLPALGSRASAALAVVAAVNPVVTAQLVTSYVDGQLASVLTALAAAAVLAVTRGGALPLVALAACGVLAAGLKFTGVVYAVGFAALAAVIAWRRARAPARRIALAGLLGVAVGVLGTGWNPYVTNWLRHGHPFFPLAGPSAIDIMEGSTDPAFLARSRVGRLAVSTFSASRGGTEAPPVLKVPFTIVGDETGIFRWPDVRHGGFGPLFSGGLLLALAAWGVALLARARPAALGGAVAAALLATVLVNPHGWWARYAPQLWLVPIVLAAAAFAAARRVPAALAAAALAVLLLDAGLVAVNGVRRPAKISARLRAELADLAAAPGPVPVRFGMFTSHARRLRDAGVPFVEAEPLPCADPATIPGSHTQYCRPGRR